MDAATDLDRAQIEVGEGLFPDADVVFMSTNESGTRGELNAYVLGQLELTTEVLPDAKALAPGYAIVENGRRLLCFVVTVTSLRTPAAALERGLRAALQDDRLGKVRSLWLPLMGTGVGRLPVARSERIIREVLRETGWAERPDVHIQISLPPRQDAFKYDRLDRASDALLRLASDLRRGLDRPASLISTRMFLFALSLADHPGAPHDLTRDSDATDFAAALRSRAGDAYGKTWVSYFRRGFSFDALHPDSSLIGPSPNMAEIMDAAHGRADSRGSKRIQIQDLVVSLLENSDGKHLEALKAMGLSPADLLKDFLAARTGRISLRLHNDVAATRDRLGYDCYAKAITDFITHAQTPPPISVSIQAPWGVGKSSLMKMIQERLDPKAERFPRGSGPADQLRLRQVLAFLDRKRPEREAPPLPVGRRWTVWFNAWKYETTEQVWAGLVDAIVTQVSARLGPVERELFLLRLQLARIDDGEVRRRIYDRVVTIWWAHARKWTLLLGASALSFAGLGAAGKANVLPNEIPMEMRQYIADHGLTGAVSLQILLAAYLVVSYFGNREKTRNEPAKFSLADYLKVPDYNKALGSVHQIHADLERVLSVLPKQGGVRTSLVIFVDDLDRCAPASVASVVEGVSTFLASELRCVFVIGMDPQMVAAALENAHSAVRDKLPSYERSVPLGWRFMDKFVQLPFTIPPSNAADYVAFMEDLNNPLENEDETSRDEPGRRAGRQLLLDLVKWLLNAAKRLDQVAVTLMTITLVLLRPFQFAADGPTEPARTKESKAPAGDAAETPTFEESRDVGAILQAVKADTAGNPRELKRLANLARFYLQLRNERSRQEPQWHPPEPECYARWIALTARWPDMMRWLLWGADEASWTPTQLRQALCPRRLGMLETHAIGKDAKAWRTKTAEALNIKVEDANDSHWLNDPKLFEFFTREQARSAGDRLSKAAEREFW